MNKLKKSFLSNSHRDLQPATDLWNRYHSDVQKYAFRAKHINQALLWQKKTRIALANLIGLQKLSYSSPAPLLVEEIDKRDYTRQKWLLRTGPYSLMPFYLLLPKHALKPHPIVLALHGHGYGVKDIVGLWEDGSERNAPDGYHQDFAVTLCRTGFAVVAPEISCFGERKTVFSWLKTGNGPVSASTCDHTAKLASHLGFSVLGIRVNDNKCLIDYLATRDDLNITQLGTMGISAGGMLALFSSCLDERIRACVLGGYFSTFLESILSTSHCSCNYVHGLSEFGEMYDLAGLIAPRPLFIDSGTRDSLFPIKAVRSSVNKAKYIYSIFGARKQISTDFFEGRHRINGKKAIPFLAASLNHETNMK